ncbi:MAG TPA: M56 family metallopeptidase [Mucilaginibacter sp.]
MDTLQYIVLANLFLSAFFGLYVLLLKKETFFQINRVYLLSALLLSFILPVIHTDWFGQSVIAEQIKYSVIAKPIDIFASKQTGESHFTFFQFLSCMYLIGIIILTLHLLIRLLAVKKIIFNSSDQSSYSFFKRIYLSESNSTNQFICEHENIHAAQWHSADVILMELVIIFNWFNPLVYLFRKELKDVHEFIADEGALKFSGGKKEYAMLLFSQTFETPINNLVNPFFNQKLLKQRIMMIQKNKSQKSALLKYLLAVPLFALMLTLSSASIIKNEALTPSEKATLFPQQKDDKVFSEVEHVPNYPGGVDKFYKFLQQNIKYPAEAKNKKIEGKVFLSFIVEKDGSLSTFKILRDPGAGCGAEAVRVMKLSPKWNPGIQNGHKVRVQYTMPISFTLEAKSKA